MLHEVDVRRVTAEEQASTYLGRVHNGTRFMKLIAIVAFGSVGRDLISVGRSEYILMKL
jgi:hypothetical protein